MKVMVDDALNVSTRNLCACLVCGFLMVRSLIKLCHLFGKGNKLFLSASADKELLKCLKQEYLTEKATGDLFDNNTKTSCM